MLLMKKLMAVVFVLTANLGIAQAADKHTDPHAHWGYGKQAGPAQWGDLKEEFAACKLGKEQSPIDIRDAKKADLPAISFDYAVGAAEVINNGHTIQLNLAAGGKVKLASGEYKLLQFHFHAPSEEKVNGKAYPMVAHLVHKNDEDKLAVVAVLFKQGKKNVTMAKILKAMPVKVDGKAELEGGINPADLLPANQAYYAYTGSLTTPPCSEGVRWQVLKSPVEISKGQIAAFRKLYPMNARPVQPLNGRFVQISQ